MKKKYRVYIIGFVLFLLSTFISINLSFGGKSSVVIADEPAEISTDVDK